MTDVTAVNYGDEAHTLLHKRIDQEATQRQAGDNAVSAKADGIRGSVDTTRNELTTEGKLRAEGDLLSDAYYRKLRKDSTDNWAEGKKDNASLDSKLTKHIDINSGSITELNQLMYAAREEFINALSAISVQHETDINLMDKRIKKYETMLQDITADSHQITADNGQVPLGAWTILSQAREWDLAIIANLKAYTEDKEKEVNDALEDIKNNLPDVEKIINEAMDDLSNHPVITELDKHINGIDQDVIDAQNALLAEQRARQEALLAESVERARLITEATDALTADVLKEHDERVDAIQRESEIRRQQLLKEAKDRTNEIDEKWKETNAAVDKRVDELVKTTDQLHTDLSKETEERIAHVKTVEDGLTVEIASRISGDQTLNTKIETLKSSTETSLAAVTNSMESMASDVAANATAITAVDSRLKVTDSELKNTTDLAASASRKAESAVDATTAQGKIIDGIETSLEELSTGVESNNKATTTAIAGLQSDVKRNKDGVEANNKSITSLRGDVSSMDGTVKGHTSAIAAIESTQRTQGSNIEQIVRDTTLLQNEVNTVKDGLATKVDSQTFNELSSVVTVQGDTVRSNSQSITRLSDSVEQVKGDLNSKASAKSVTDIQNRVTATEAGIASNSSSILGVQNELATVKGSLSTKADASAVQELKSEVSDVQGKVVANTNATTALAGRVAATEGEISKKVDSTVLVDYYTKVEANKATAGALQAYDSQLVIGGDNVWSCEGRPLVKEAGTVVFEVINSLDEHFKFTLGEASSNGNISFYFDSCLVDTKHVLTLGDTYTFTCLVRASRTAWIDRIYTFFGASQHMYRGFRTLENEWVLYELTIPVTATGVDGLSQLFGFNVQGGFVKGDVIEVRHIQMQRGNKSTTFQKASSGMVKSIEANASILDNVKTEVSNQDGAIKANTESIRQQDSRITSVDKELKTTTATAAQALSVANTATSANAATSSRLDSVSASLDQTNKNVDSKASITSYNELKADLKVTNDRSTANASNISGLQSRMSSAEGSITSNADAVSGLTIQQTKQGQSIDSLVRSNTALTSSIQDINKDLNGVKAEVNKKADATAVSNLEVRTAQNERDIVAGASSTVQLSSKLDTEVAKLQKYTRHTIDTQGLDPDLWYPVSTSMRWIGDENRANFRVYSPLDRNKAVWATHGSGTYSVDVEWSESMSGWGANDVNRIVHSAKYVWAGDKCPVILITQISPSSEQLVYLRGGALYHMYVTPTLVPVLHREEYVSPYGTYPPLAYAEELAPVADVETKASSKALTDLSVLTSSIDGRVVNNTNAITVLTSQVVSAERELETKVNATVLNDYYTITEADKATAGQVREFKSEYINGPSGFLDVTVGNPIHEWGWGHVTFPDSDLNWFKYETTVAGNPSFYFDKSVPARKQPDIVIGQNYTYSGYIRSSNPESINIIYIIFGGGGSKRYIYPKVVDKDWFYFSTTVVPELTDINAPLQFIFGFRAVGAVVGDIYEMKGCQVVRGGQDTRLISASNLTTYYTMVEADKAMAETLSTLNSRIDTTNADLRNNYYTAAQTNEAVSGNIASFKAELGVVENLFDNSGFNSPAGNFTRWFINDDNAKVNFNTTWLPYIHVLEIQALRAGGQFTGVAQILQADDYAYSNRKVQLRFCTNSPVTRTLRVGVHYTNSGGIITQQWQSFVCTTGYTNLHNMTFPAVQGATSLTVMFVEDFGASDPAYPWYLIQPSVTTGEVPISYYAPNPKDMQTSITATAEALRTTEASVTSIDGVVRSQASDVLTLSTSSNLGANLNYCEKPLTAVGAMATGITGFGWHDFVVYDAASGNGSWVANWMSHTEYGGINSAYDREYDVCTSFDICFYDYLDNQTATNFLLPEIYYSAGGYKRVKYVSPIHTPVKGVWYRVYAVYRKTPAEPLHSDHLGLGGFVGRIFLRNLKVEVGSVPTPYSADAVSGKIQLQATNKVVDGVMAVSTVSVDNNGFISGYGLISQLVNGVVVSAFGVNADMFYVGTNNSNKKKPFIVLTTPQVINGTLYPAGTWIDTAVIANATIGTAHIKDLAVTNAKIANLAVDNAKISNLHGSKITANSISAGQIGANQIYTRHILANQVTADKILVNSLSALNIKVKEGDIDNLSVSTLKIQDNAVTVATAVEGVKQVVVDVVGGVVRIDIGIKFRFDWFNGNENTGYRWRVELYRNNSLIKKMDWLPWNGFFNNGFKVWANYNGVLPPIIDRPGVGRFTYLVKAFDGNGAEMQITYNPSSGKGYEPTIAIMEIKK